TKWECAIGTGPDDLRATATIPTTTPEETIGRVVAFFEREGPIAAIGIGSFGPVDRNPGSATWGHITSTPKPGWAYTDVGGEIARRLSVPVAFDTDVNAAALAEHRWGAAQELDTFCYVTVGTGIGGGGMAGGRLLHGLLHPEFGHMRIPHDRESDPFEGVCPYHGDCWEGLASGRAIEARWGRPAAELDADEAVWVLQAHYLALGLVSVICVLSPERILLGGGVMRRPGLLPLVHREVEGLMNGYQETATIMLPALAPRSGVLGAIALAEAGERGSRDTTSEDI
ncbi:MAG TPA: ROK family protein, partial [Geminicoccaceae bacterium]|nr:ROK family protein [Geminicoccaceae bacterium]